MARYTGAKGRINRRLQATIYESSGAIKALDKRGNQPPGMHTRFRRPSNYGQALMEKQKIKHYYGVVDLRAANRQRDPHGRTHKDSSSSPSGCGSRSLSGQRSQDGPAFLPGSSPKVSIGSLSILKS